MNCKYCDAELNQKGKIFCNQSCSARYNNSKRAPRTEESKLKTSNTIRNLLLDPLNSRNIRQNEIIERYNLNPNLCSICNKILPYKEKGRRTCSKECKSQLDSIHGTLKLRKRRANGENFSFRRTSTLEQIFEDFLKSKNITNSLSGFLREVYAKNPLTRSGYYRLDFVLPKKKIVIEIDGRHHEQPEQVKHDVIRDYNIQKRGWFVLRINYYEVNKPTILEMIYDQYLK